MRCFKTVVSIFIIAGMLASGAFTAYSDGADEGRYAGSVELLGVLGVIGKGDGDAEKKITRAEFAAMMYKILGENSLRLSTPFSDVPADYKLAKEIEAVSVLGIMNGYADQTFRPDDAILIQDVIKTLICVAGYDVKAQAKGGYPLGYLQTAREDGMLAGFGADLSGEAALGQTAQLIENMLNMPQLVIEAAGIDIFYKKSPEHTVMYRYFQMERGRGIVTANALTSLSKAIYSKKGSVRVDDVPYQAGETAAEEMLGQSVVFYYTASDDDEAEIIYIREHRNEFLTIEAADLLRFENERYTYFDGRKNNAAMLSRNCRIIYNNRALEEFSTDKLFPSTGYVSMVDHNDDGEYDVVFVFDYDHFIIGSIDSDAQKVYNKQDGSKSLALDGVNRVPSKSLRDTNGKGVDLSALAPLDVISVLKSDDYMALVVLKDKIAGSIEEIRDSGTQTEYLINGTAYRLSPTFSLSAEGRRAAVGDTGVFRLNIMKDIEYFEYTATGVKAAYVVNARVNSAGLDHTVLLKLYTEDGSMEVFKTVPNRLQLNGRDAENGEGLLGSIAVGTLILYDTNSEGRISKLYTPLPYEGGTENTSLYQGYASGTDVVYKSRGKIFDGKAALAADSIVFFAPPASFADRDDYYQVGDASSLIDGFSYHIEAFNTDGGRLSAKYLLVKGQISVEKINELTGFSVVDKITGVLNKDGMPGYQLELYSAGATISRILESEQLLNCGTTPRGVPITVSEGDIVRFAVDFNGVINELQMTYDVETGTFYDRTSAGTYDARIKTAFGYVIDIENTLLKLAGDYSGENAVLYSTDGAAVYVYDSGAGRNARKVRDGKYTDILSYSQVGEACARAFVYLRGGVPRTIVIYK